MPAGPEDNILLPRISPRARLDVLRQMLYLEQEEDEDLAIRYFDTVMETCSLLANQPLAGEALSKSGRLSGIRRALVRRPFEKYLMFYRAETDGITVLRVLHGYRDIDRQLFD